MPDRSVPLTRDGLKKLEDELDYLKSVRRHEVAQRIHMAKEVGHTQNDAEYDDAKNEQAFVEGRINQLETIVKNHVLIDEDQAHHSRSVRLGCTVVVESASGRREYTIVGSTEADPTSGRISNESPVGKALIGHRVGDKVQVLTPKGPASFTVSEIK
ncbi:MAG TPA: transcription elongation factor GreA [Thermomicrobiales bacterium]|nr:transcription elongation factor GreA [Thermomicrobiales bacterium]